MEAFKGLFFELFGKFESSTGKIFKVF